ncbi:MAG: 5-demethoxyubiquinol-8 5-hydroxylase UbiM [Xanthomonadaceae bacterium]|jgi:ubiquinone biosynthesis UbiH/UbiF/VisC/COQ6 family hydroxylase|nr:5-demethoxyubiquinol-8 5-hydroxylase UbiM [Xanthomonadaceae bacterium]
MNYDIIIIGAGPAGLCLAKAVADMGLRIAMVERQMESDLAEPAFDGREIALTHASMRLLRQIGVWKHIPETDISPLCTAKIMNGASPHALQIGTELTGHTQLGSLIPNHLIRKAAWLAMRETVGITLFSGMHAETIETYPNEVRIRLNDGSQLTASLLIAADSRFSETRRALGIDADMRDFGKSMLVCRMHHEHDHQQTAWEWFDHGQTLALLPLDRCLSSTVITVTGIEARRLSTLPEEQFAREIERRYDYRLGNMRLESTRHVYPLVGVYARRFVGTRFALVGDAAVGMHPVTAHGFNFGLASIERLTDSLGIALRQGRDPGDPTLLSRYQRRHRKGTLPLFLTTCGIVELYTNDRMPARWLREATLRIGGRLLPFQRAIASTLVDDGPVDTPIWKHLKNGIDHLKPALSGLRSNR